VGTSVQHVESGSAVHRDHSETIRGVLQRNGVAAGAYRGVSAKRNDAKEIWHEACIVELIRQTGSEPLGPLFNGQLWRLARYCAGSWTRMRSRCEPAREGRACAQPR
jgi:hypothetical protein